MEEKKGFGESVEAFFAGKGFYIVLFLCVAVIGVSAWAMLSGNGTIVENSTVNLAPSLSSVEEEEEYLPTVKTEEPTAEEAGNAGSAARTELATVPEVEDGAAAATETQPEASPAPAEEPQTAETAAVSAQLVAEAEAAAAAPEPSAAVETAVQEASSEGRLPFIWPVAGETENGYSMAALTYDRTMRDWRTHDGIDIAAPLGETVKAAAAGVVASVFEDPMYGTAVRIDHGGGLQSLYANLEAVPTVSEGDNVVMGQVIGSIGETALCESGEVTHLHFAMSRDGESVDPSDYLP